MMLSGRKGFLFLALLTGCAVAAAALTAAAQTEGTPPAEQAEAARTAGGGISGVADTREIEEALMDPNLFVGIQEAYNHHLALRQPQVDPQKMKTLFFTLWQHKLLQEAKYAFRTRPVSPGELASSGPEQRIRGIRELSLGGIVYASSEDWVVWLNGQRVTPDAIPKEIIDIKVKKDYIELKWYDSYTQLVFPVRMRTHQRFNLDTRIFLPGTAPL